MSAGLDSLGSVEFANVLAQKLGMQMPGTLVFDYPSVNAVTEYLTAQLVKSAAAAAPAEGAAAPEEGEGFLGVDPSTEGALFASSGMAGELASSAYVRRGRQRLAVLAVVARPLMAALAAGAAGQAGSAGDQIHRVPLQRWDLDLAERLQNDPFTLAAQVCSTCIKL
jgi:hypothetical protein